jgi:hypothetical protein
VTAGIKGTDLKTSAESKFTIQYDEFVAVIKGGDSQVGYANELYLEASVRDYDIPLNIDTIDKYDLKWTC